MEYNFKDQLEWGKKWEQVVFDHLLGKHNTVHLKDMSDDKTYQPLWIDWMLIYENQTTGIYHSMFFDVKTDFRTHKTGNLFIETWCDSKGYTWCVLSTKAEYFLFYDPHFWKLYHLPIYPIRERYRQYGLSKKHISVKNAKGYSSEGLALSIDEIEKNILWELVIEDIKKLDFWK